MEAFSLRAKMDIRAPRANRGAGLRGQGCYRPDAVSARPMGHLSRHSLGISKRILCVRESRRRRCGERLVVVPDGPDHPSEFIRDGDRRFVVTAPAPGGERPLMESRQWLLRRGAMMGGAKHCAGPVREQTSEIDIATFTDPTESASRAAGVFARR